VLNSTDIYTSYLRFDVTGIRDAVASAQLRMFVTDGSPDGGHLFAVSNTWSEGTITWANAPAIGGAEIATAGAVTAGTWITVDVSGVVRGDGTYSFAIKSLSTNSAFYGSRESATPPELVIATGGPPPPSPVAGFAANPVSGLAPLAVAFIDTSTGTPTSWSWDFDANGTTDSTARNPTMIYRTPGTFSVRLTTGNATGTSSALRSELITVSPGPGPAADDAVLVGAGDIASCGGSGDELTAAQLDGLPGVVFTAGDNAYDSGTAAEFSSCYEPSWGRHRSRTRPVPGNHEYLTAGAAPYFAYFGAAAGTAGQGWYSYELGKWHVIALNSNCDAIGGCGAGSSQAAWLEADLAAHPAACTVAYWHHPVFSSGTHGNESEMTSTWAVLDAAGVDLVVSGHDHDYERFAPQDGAGVADPTGIREIVIGTGGKSLVGFSTIRPNSEVRSSSTYGVLRIDLRSAGYSWEFLPTPAGGFADAGSTFCR
jgi:PKD repeat protein